MQSKEHVDMQELNNQNYRSNTVNCGCGRGVLYSIDGCVVSITSTPKGTDETLKAIKDILLFSYRTKTQNA